MQCPTCNHDLKVLSYEGVAIERCSNCHGEWLDYGELKTVVAKRDKKFEPAVRKKILEQIKENKKKPLEISRSLTCPRCSSKTSAVIYAGDSGIVIDRCESCRGVWVDAGELEMIQVFVESNEGPI